MNKIIVAIDFMESSINAFLHGLSIADKIKCDLLLVWVKKTAAEKEKFGEGKDPSKEVEKAFNELVEKYQPELPDNKILFKIREGKVYKEITAEAQASKALMVLAGTHGASGFEEFWIGSNANKIVSASPCPVITFRSGINISRPLTRIVLPIDNAMETRQKAPFTGYLAKKHDAEIIILKMYTSKVKDIRYNIDLYASQVAQYLEQEGNKCRMDGMDCDNISDAMINFAKKVDANLISIMTSQESTTANLWLGPYAHQTVNHSPIPVLSIHPRETLTAGLGF